jgi:hypothetical protein
MVSLLSWNAVKKARVSQLSDSEMRFKWIRFTRGYVTGEHSQAVPAPSDYLFSLHEIHYLIKIMYYMKDKYDTRISRNIICIATGHVIKMNETVSG